MSYFRNIGTVQKTFGGSFAIIASTGQASEAGQGTNTNGDNPTYMVSDGVAFSTFNYDNNTYIPIKGLNEPWTWDYNEKAYLEFTILSNLQVSGAEVKINQVGTDEDWPDYPNMIEIRPEDVVDPNTGRVTKIVDGKRQTKCYVLIGYRQDDDEPNGPNNPPQLKAINDNPAPVQILNTDLIMMNGSYNGVATTFPIPYLDGNTHYQHIKNNGGIK